MDDPFETKSRRAAMSRRQFLASGAIGSAALVAGALLSRPARAAAAAPEKDSVKLGFIKLTDMAPLAIALEKGFFDDEGLSVTLEAQANWKVLLDGVISGSLDGAHMLAGQPLAASIGLGTKARLVTPCALDLNGNAVTVSNAVWGMMKPGLKLGDDGKVIHPIGAAALRPVLESYKAAGKAFNMGIVFPVSTHNYYLRYWLAAGDINPGFYTPSDMTGQTGADVLLSVTPPPQMPATMEAGTIDGYCVGEPWNQAAVFKGIGVPVIADRDIWTNHPEKVFGLTEDFAKANPNTVTALVKAIIRAGQWLDADDGANRAEAVGILSQSQYVGADKAVIANSMTGTFEFEKGDKRPVPDFNVFFKNNATYPFISDAIWFLTQMRRWGQIAESPADDWYATTAKSVYRPDLYEIAAKQLVDDGKLDASAVPFGGDGYKPASSAFIDGTTYDPRQPGAYVDSLKIGLKSGQSSTSVG